MVKAQIFTTIPDVLLIEVQKLNTAKEVWDAVCTKHEGKALTVKINIQRRMYKMKCEDELQVRTHLKTLLKIQEQLVGMGSGLPDVDLITILLRLLLKCYCP